MTEDTSNDQRAKKLRRSIASFWLLVAVWLVVSATISIVGENCYGDSEPHSPSTGLNSESDHDGEG